MSTPNITTEAELRAWYEANPWGDQDENGFDLDRFRENRRLSPAERVAQFESFRRGVLELEKYRRNARAV